MMGKTMIRPHKQNMAVLPDGRQRTAPEKQSFIVLFCGLLAICLFVFSAAPAQAQNDDSRILVLNDESGLYDIVPHGYITPDPDRMYSFRQIIERHQSGLRGRTVESEIIPLGSQTTPYWIVFSIGNRTNEEDWVLSFGEKLDGRIGMIEDIFLYEHETKTRYVDTVSPVSQEDRNRNAISGTTVRMSLGKRDQALLVMYVIPEAGMPLTFTPYLMTEKTYLESLRDPFSGTRLMNIFLLLTISFFMAALVMRQMWSAVFIIAFYGLQIGFYNFQNTSIINDFFWPSEVPGILFCVSLVLIFTGGRYFLNLVGRDDSEGRILLAITVAVIMSCTLALMLLDRQSLYYPIVMYVPGMLCLAVFVLVCIARGITTVQPTFFYALGWAFLFCGMAGTSLAAAGLIEPSRMMMNAYWYSLFPQALLLITACIQRYALLEYRAFSKAEKEQEMAEAVSTLRQSKEASENLRLLKVIEHERQVMNELREREVKQNEDMRKAVAEADEANRSKSAFLAVVSHEIRTPMTGIMGMIRLLLETQLDKKQRDYSQTIMDSGDAMMALLNDILDFEKIESGRLDLEYVDFDLHRILNSVITLMSGHAEAKKISLKLDIGSDVPRYFIGDPVRLRQVLLNLCGNSIKFTEEGSVTLRIQIDGFGQEPSVPGSHKLRFSIEDTGIGISQEAQKNLFNPFSQADSSITRKFGGTGLGLTICQRLIEAMGDRIRINSQEGEGSTFYFTLVMKASSAEEAEQAQIGRIRSGSRTSGPAMKILVVEDNEINQKLLKEFLERMGHNIRQVMNGEDAVEAVREDDFDAVLMDIELPGISGMGATKSIRALPDRKRAAIPVIALTGNIRDEDIRACYAANMNGHIAKPIDPAKLKTMLEKVAEDKLDNPVVLDDEMIDHQTPARKTPPETPEPEPKPESEKPSEAPESTRRDHNNPQDQAANTSVPWRAEYPWEKGVAKAEEEKERGGKERGSKDTEHSDDSGDLEMEDMSALSLPPIKSAGRETGYDGNRPQQPTDMPPVSRFVQEEENEDEEDSFAAAIKATEKEGDGNGKGDTPMFDREMLQSLKETIAPDQMSELLSGMFAKADEIVAAIDAAWQEEDILSLAARSHELKGMSGNFGLSAVSEQARQIETASKSNDLENMGQKVTALSAVYAESRAALESWFSDS